MRIKEQAFAKVNLCLHVTGQRSDGYHLLDSIVTFADFGDTIEVAADEKLHLQIDGMFGAQLSPNDDNLILRAAKTLSNMNTAKIHLTKNLPIASGIGGGSADAAATLRALSKLWNIPLDANMALSLGADVPVCLSAKSQRMQGIGEDLSDIPYMPQLPAVLINSGDAISTPMVFDRLKDKENQQITNIPRKSLSFSECIDWLSSQRNDLQDPAKSIVPVIDEVLELLNGTGAKLSRMSGSGATCFGLYQTIAEANNAANRIAKVQPSWWVKPVMLGERG